MLSPERISVLFAGDAELSSALESAWMQDLSDARRRHIEAMPDPSDRRRSLMASRLLAQGIREFGVDTQAPVHSSASHCPGRVVCAVSPATPVGVDVEPVDAPAPGRTSLYLNAAEREMAGDDPRALLWLWTRKEAVAKAAGRRGLRSLPLIDVRADTVGCAGRDWQLMALDLGPEFVAHLACAVPAPSIRVRSHSAESLR
jgi:4'-phosphopantetheinyl transferase